MTRGTPEGWKPLLVRMPVALHDTLRQVAGDERRSMAEVMRHALRLYTAAALRPDASGES